MNTFLEQTRDYIFDVLDDELILPTFVKIDISIDGKMGYNLFCKGIRAGDRFKPTNIIKYLTLFTIFDSYLEIKYPCLQGHDFGKRFNKLPENTASARMEKIGYCILLIIRNTIIHHIDNLLEIDEKIEASYNQSGLLNTVSISISSLNYILSYIAYMINGNILNDYYFEKYSKEYYRQTINGLNKLVYKDRKVLKQKIGEDGFSIIRKAIYVKENANIEEVINIIKAANQYDDSDILIHKDGIRLIIPSIEYSSISKMKLVNEKYSFNH